ncbi:hypothetical protein NIES2130_35770 [Scytonema sp. HK-05]|nr:hypothetical protein NIES2130_35770 [Scytonema sp. HK-05]
MKGDCLLSSGDAPRWRSLSAGLTALRSAQSHKFCVWAFIFVITASTSDRSDFVPVTTTDGVGGENGDFLDIVELHSF